MEVSRMTNEEKIQELESEIKLMKEVIVALADIAVCAGWNCTYPEQNDFYN